MTETYVALLRGINVGGRNKLPMPGLIALCTELGGTHVQTYIQSGNIIFQADADAAAEFPAMLTSLIAERFSLRVPVTLRTTKQLAEVLTDTPFLAQGASAETLHVMFLIDLPSAEQVASLDPARSPSDTFIVQGREIYLHLPNGVADTKLTNAYFDAKLATTCTSRNWKTVTKLLELMSR